MGIRLMIPLVVLLINLEMSFGKPQSSISCSYDEAAIRTEQGKVICWKVPNCPHGFGLSFEHKPGYVHPSSIKVKCQPCKSGLTYSNKHDFSQCKNCTQCKDNEISTGKCYFDKDEIHCTGQCKESFYMSNETASCKPCSQCCIDSGCANSCRPEMTSKNCTKTSNGTEIPGSKISVEDMDRPIKVHKVKNRTKDVVKIVVPVVCFAVVLSISIIAVIVYRKKICERIGSQLVACAVNSTGNNSDSTIEPRSLQGNVYRQQLHSPLSSPPPLSPQPEQHSQSDILAPGQSSISDSTEQLVTDSGLPGRIPGQQACSPQRVLTDSGQPAYNTVQTHCQINPHNVDNAEENFNKLLVSISPRVSVDWKPLGGLLGVEPHELSNIDDENRRTEDKAYQMLLKWRQKNGRGATPQVLVAALRGKGRNDLSLTVQEFIVTGQYTISNSE